VIRDPVVLHEPNEIGGRVARQRRFCEVGIGGEEIIGPRVQIGEVAAASAGDKDLLSWPLRALKHGDTTPPASSFDCSHEAGRSSAEDEGVEFVSIHDASFID
jgi:hypothetical protein